MDDMTADGNALSVQILQNSSDSTSQCKWIVTQSKLQKQDFLKERNGKSIDLCSMEHAFQLAKRKLNAETHKQAATKGGCSNGLPEHLRGGNTAFDDIHGTQTSCAHGMINP